MNAYSASPHDNQTVVEFESFFRESTLKPQFLGCTWQHFQEQILRNRVKHQPYEPQEVLYFARMDGDSWMWNTSLDELVEEMREMYL